MCSSDLVSPGAILERGCVCRFVVGFVAHGELLVTLEHDIRTKALKPDLQNCSEELRLTRQWAPVGESGESFAFGGCRIGGAAKQFQIYFGERQARALGNNRHAASIAAFGAAINAS